MEIERYEASCGLLPFVTPAPAALCTNGLGIEELTRPGQPSHYAMMRAIYQKLRSWSPAIFVGFNSIRFDEEFLRNAFMQTLHPPYLTSLHSNGRADAMALVMAANAVIPGTVSCCITPKGNPSYRLADLAAQNGIPHRRSHNATADVEATLSLCRLVQDRAPEAFSRWSRFSRKAAVEDILEIEDALLLTEFLGNQPVHTPVACIGFDPAQQARRICLDLRIDPSSLAALDDAQLRERLAHAPFPIRVVKSNAGPVLTPLYDASFDMATLGGIGALEDRARSLRSDRELCARIVAAHLETSRQFSQSDALETQLYGRDFFPRSDERHMERFHENPWSDRLDIALSLSDPRLRCFALRQIYLHDPTSLGPTQLATVQSDLLLRFRDPERCALTRAEAASDAAKIMSEDPSTVSALSAYVRFLNAQPACA